MSHANRVTAVTRRSLQAGRVVLRGSVAAAAAMAALPALGFAILTAAGTAAAGPAQAQTCSPTETSSVTASSSITATSSVTPTPDESATPEASPTGSAEPTCSSPTASAVPMASPSPSSSPTPSETPSADASQVETASGEPRPAAIRGVLTADESEMEGLAYAGIVTAETATGEVRALRFTADRNRLTDMRIAVTQSELTQTSHGSGDTVLSGHVVMDVTLFKATLLGAPVEFTPDNPPPAELILPDMTFTDVEAHLLLMICDKMTVDGFSQTLG